MNERIAKIVLDERVSSVVIVGSAFGVGVGVGYLIAKRKYQKLAEILYFPHKDIKSEDVAEPLHPSFIKDNIISNGEELVKKKFEVLSLETNDEVEIQQTTVIRSVFPDDFDDWDPDEELPKRTETEPYILHKNEFFEEEKGYSQLSLTYFFGDDILVDEQFNVLSYLNVVGDNLRFGRGSGDPNVVYIRNDKRKAEYEVTREEGFYSIEVLGLEIEHEDEAKELKHSAVPKFRRE